MELAVQWRGKLSGKIAAAIPVWASDHWTLLMLTRDGVTKDDWIVEYRDSLTTQSEACANTAKKLLEIASAATDADLVLPPRCNTCMQPRMSGTCGFYVAHWIDAKMREVYNKEQKMATGNPMIAAMKKRLMSMVEMAAGCLTWVGKHEDKMDDQVAREELEKKDAETSRKPSKRA